jgi:hypothetical protein
MLPFSVPRNDFRLSSGVGIWLFVTIFSFVIYLLS